MKKKLTVLLVLAACMLGIVYMAIGGNSPQLVANASGSKQVDSFILHIRAENTDDGVKVFRSLQYVGKEPIDIQHRTPLIACSLKRENHDFTGSPVKKVLKRGDSYHPQHAWVIEAEHAGTYDLYCTAKFKLNGKEMEISHVETLQFEK